ncbi:acyltransferase family protein [Parvularcula oceani]|uniref:acyltransferase family protein n=1 Tax=Parvularcula oceani TaxID=1247963 RepID=UPI0004E1C925|nr:acyltransferase [Parvularcula oceani]
MTKAPQAAAGVSRGHTDLMRVLCIFGITWFHMSYRLEAAWPEAPMWLLAVIGGYGRLSSPLLGLMSGLLFGLALARTRSPARLTRRRITGLLSLYLFWNLAAVGLGVCASLLFGKQPQAGMVTLNGVLGITAWPFNFPLHYLADIAKGMAAFYLLNRLIGRNWPALCAACILLVTGLVLVSGTMTNAASALPRIDSTLFFMAGALLGIRPAAGGRILRAMRDHDLVLMGFGGAGFAFGVSLMSSNPWIVMATSAMGGLFVFLLALRLPEPPSWVNSALALRLFCTHVIVFMALNVLFGIEDDPSVAWWLAQPFLAVLAAWASLAAEARWGRVLPALRPREGPAGVFADGRRKTKGPAGAGPLLPS